MEDDGSEHATSFFPQRYVVHVEIQVSSSFPSAEWRNKMQKNKVNRTIESVAAG